VFCSFLALVLKTALEERIAALGRSGSWPEIIADLDSLIETEIAYDGASPYRRPSATPRPPDTRQTKNVVPSRRGGVDYGCRSVI
jgi:hypothetical protein